MGLIQVVRQFSTIRQAFRTVQGRLKTDRPDVLVLIDYPGFNLRVAKFVRENHHIPVCYYIAPKAWAWNSSRFTKIRACTDHVALILPFELPIYKKLKIRATYVGNPLMDEYPPCRFCLQIWRPAPARMIRSSACYPDQGPLKSATCFR